MGVFRGVLVVWIVVSVFLHDSSNVEGRTHFHKKHNNDKGSPVADPPAYSPDPSPPPVYPPPVPSDPSPNPDDPGNSNSEPCVFDVTSFGAVGDGTTDDTAAFMEAWKAACAVESGIVLVPADHVFMITSTIFSGPCKPGLVFQVRMPLFSSIHSKQNDPMNPELSLNMWIGGWSPNATQWPGLLAKIRQQEAMARLL